MFKKEVGVFLILFLVLALLIHMDQWLIHPLEHLHRLATHEMPYHPLLYTTIVYLFLGIIRLVFNAFAKLFKRK